MTQPTRPLKQRETNMKKLAMMVYKRLHHRHEGKKRYGELKELILKANEILDEMQAEDMPDRVQITTTAQLGRGKRQRERNIANPAKARLKAGQVGRTEKAAGI